MFWHSLCRMVVVPATASYAASAKFTADMHSMPKARTRMRSSTLYLRMSTVVGSPSAARGAQGNHGRRGSYSCV